MKAGDTISRYRILGSLGQGGGGIVFRAEDTLLNRPVALKFLASGTLTESDKQRLLNEARAAAQVRHPNICPVYDIEEADGQLFIAMACLDGETLSKRIARGPLSIDEAVDIAAQVARGLQRAHDAGIVHRDIKSNNIIVSPDRHVSVLDFGLALFAGAARITAVGSTVGTPAYMSPEQAEGQAIDHRTDIWSMGVVLYEMLTGRLPFGGGGGAQMFRAIVSQEPAPLTSLRPDVPETIQRVVAKALEKQPGQRWQSARDMAAAMTDTVVMPSRPGTAHNASPRHSVYSKKRASFAAVALGLLAAGAYALLHQTPPVPQVAVIPFEVIGESASARITSDGLVEVLTTALSELSQFQGRVLAVPASEIRRRSIRSAEEARRVYGVTLAITGSAQQVGDSLQFTANLVDTAKLRSIRGKTFEYNPRDPIGSRNGAIDQVARLLEMELTPTARRELAAGDSSNPTAYAAYLQGLGFLARYDVSGNLDQAVASFQSATRQDPAFALAFARLGESYWRMARSQNDPQLAGLASSNAETAVRLNPKLAIVHAVLGSIQGANGHEESGVRELRKALEIDPSNPEAQRELARLLNRLGRAGEAEEAYLKSTRARPTDWYGFLLLGFFYYDQERYGEAETALKTALSLTPDNSVVRQNLGAFYLTLGQYDQSIAVLQSALQQKPTAGTYAAYGAALYYLHRFPEALAAAQKAVKLSANSHSYWGNLGIYAKWAPASGVHAADALKTAVALAEKQLQVTPNDYDTRANLAEYRARLGDAKGCSAEIARIPEAARSSRAARLAIAYELMGRRSQAIQVVTSNLKTPASLNQIKDDPDLHDLWEDSNLQKALALRKRPPAF